MIQEETGKSGLDLGRAQCDQLVQILTLQLYTVQFSSRPNTVQMFGNIKINTTCFKTICSSISFRLKTDQEINDGKGNGNKIQPTPYSILSSKVALSH